MPRIFDNIEQSLLPALKETLGLSHRSDFCVGYFNLRRWKQIDSYIEQWTGGEGRCCRQRFPSCHRAGHFRKICEKLTPNGINYWE